jgi:hypothetical protein
MEITRSGQLDPRTSCSPRHSFPADTSRTPIFVPVPARHPDVDASRRKGSGRPEAVGTPWATVWLQDGSYPMARSRVWAGPGDAGLPTQGSALRGLRLGLRCRCETTPR